MAAFRRLEDAGRLEILTCGATHGFLPLMQMYPEAVRAQVAVAVAHHRRHFGRDPAGIWLPECGYFPGLDRYLAEQGIRFFFVDTHGVTDATPRPRFGVYAPIYTPTGPAAFARDPESSMQVWSAESGYPGDPDYREFYRDVGWDLDFDYVKEYVQPTGQRKNVGIKYFRITGKTAHKQPYDPARARERAAQHAGNFLFNRERQIEHLSSRMAGTRPIVVSPYDAELYGHWWYEGPMFIDFLIRKVAFDQRLFRLATPGDYLRENPEQQVATPPLCSWGAGGYAGVWLDGSNDWVYRHLHKAAERMIALARDVPVRRGPAAAGAQPGRARAPPRAILGLGLHHEDGDHGGVRHPPHEGAPAPVHPAARPGPLRPDRRELARIRRGEGQHLPGDRLPGVPAGVSDPPTPTPTPTSNATSTRPRTRPRPRLRLDASRSLTAPRTRATFPPPDFP